MNCPSCAHANRPGAKFCEECAAPLKRACASCGSELRPSAKFCDECGTAATAAAPAPRPAAAAADTRKVVTIIFGDLVGSTALHERLDAESVRQFMESYYAAMRGAVEAHGGRVTQVMGDGVKAVFGAPRVAEDDAIRAVRAGVAMQDAFRALAEQQRGRVGTTGLRVAVNTGEVVANDEAEIIGDPVNVAARLQEQGKDGDVIIGESTHRLVSTLVTLELLGSFALKGRAEAVRAYRVVSLDRPAGAATAPFVGRVEELARLTAVYGTAVEKPAAALAVLVGSPGLGKSRLIDEFARRHADAATVVQANCDAAGGATFAPLAGALRELLGIEGGASAESLRATLESALPAADADRARIAGGIASLLAGSPASPEETFFVVRRLLGALAQAKPVVLVIDDLHWAEPLLLDLVEHLIQWGSGVPLFVLIGARPELRDLRSSLVTPGGFVSDVVTLSGLDAGAAMRLAANVIGAADLPAAIAAKVLATSEGNPLFVGELVRMLVQEGALTKDGDRWTAGANLAALEMPPTIHALLAARIERLRPEERTVLERAAVVGRHFSRSAVAALLPGQAGDLDARLEALRRTELIERDTGWLLGEPVLRFHHVLIRDAAYRRLLKGTRAELHAQLADWIEAQVGDAAEHDETIGWHLEQAHQFLRELGPLDETGRRLGDRAATRLAAAGRRSLARDDLAVAADLLGRAIDRLDAGDPARADLALDWCEALLAAGDVGPAAAAIADLARFASDSERLRAWHTCFVGQHTVLTAPSALHETTGAVAAAADALTAQGDAAGEAKAHYVHALALSRLGKVGACEAALDRALAAARRAGDRRRANTVLAIAPLAALWGPSPVTRASGRCLDVVRVLRITQGAPAVEAVALSCQGVLEALRGRGDAARRMIASARKMVEELGITQRLLEADVFVGLVELLEGDAPAAERSLRGAYEGLRELGLGIDAARAAALLARALLAQDRVAEAEALSHESEALAGDDLKAAIAWRGARAEALARRGEHAAAVGFASKAVELAAATDALLDHADARLALAAALRAAGRGREADAEERCAKELWQAKGATLLAERATHATTPVAPPAAADAPRAAHAPRRRPVRPNFAFEEMRRAEAAVAARDAQALEALYRRDVEIIDHQFGITYGHAAIVERVRAIIEESTESAFAHEPLASLGDSLGLCRLRSTATGSTVHGVPVGATEVPYLLLIEADEQGSARRIEIFGDDKLGDAVVRLYERYAELLPDGPERARAAMTARSVAALAWTHGEPDECLAGVLAPDFVGVDYRHLSNWSLHGAASYIEHLRALREVADDVEFRQVDVVALAPHAQLLRVLHTGTDRAGGGVYERPFLSLFVNDADGKLARGEWFDDAREIEALARFDALGGGAAPTPSVRRRVSANAATAIDDRFVAAVVARDLEAARACFDPNFAEIDHSIGSQHGHDPAMAGLEYVFRSPDLELENERLATLGPSLLLARRSYRGSSFSDAEFETGDWRHVQIALEEAGDQGRFVRAEVFAPDKLGEAVARLYERYAELLPDGPERARATASADAFAAMQRVNADPVRLAPAIAPDFESVDHRHLSSWSLRGADAYLAHLRALREVADDIELRPLDVIALTPTAQLLRVLHTGTARAGGGPYERPFLRLFVAGPDGRIARAEWFDADREAEALARFDAVTGGTPARVVPARVGANTVTAAVARMDAAFAAGDLDAFAAQISSTLEFFDHPVGATYGHGEAIDGVRAQLRSREPRWRQEPIATLGSRVGLFRRTVSALGTTSAHFDVGATERVDLLITETDGAGATIERVEVFAADHLGDAIVRLYERWAAQLPEGAERARVETVARAVAALDGPTDPDRLAATYAPDLKLVDHRLFGTWSARSAAELVAHWRAQLALSPDSAARFDEVLALDANRLARRTTYRGTGRDSGGSFENHVLELLVFAADGRLARVEVFEPDQQAEVLARFDALVAGAPSARRRVRANAATASVERFVAVLEARDAGALPAFFDDALCVVHHASAASYGKREMLATWRSALRAERLAFRRETLATLGDTLVLSRQVTALAGLREAHLADFGATEVDEISLVETDAGVRTIHVELFAPDRLGDAIARLYQRNAELLAEGPERERAVATARSVAVVAPGGFDRNRYAAAFRPDVEIVDRRLLGLGAGVGLEMLFRSMTATSEVADHVASRPQDVLALTHDALLLRWLVSGVGRESGGAFEWAFLRLFVFDADGRVARYELFDVDREAEALARFDALAGRSPEVPAEPFANAASRYNDRFVRAWDARDWNAVREIHRPTCRVDDRRRMMRIESPAEDGFRFYFDQPRSRWIVTPIATRGERLVLSRLLLECDVEAEGGAAAIDYLCVDEVDADGLSAAMVVFDPDDEDAAYAELDARFEADPSELHGRVVGEFVRAIAGRDWDAVAALCSPAFVEHDHRSLAVLGTTRGAEAWVQNFRALVELAPDTIYRSLHVRTAERGFLSVGTWLGSREGGRYEIPLVAVLEVDAHGAIARADLYEPDQQEQALARFRELATATASRFANAASRANRKRTDCFNARDWAGVESCVSADLVFEERRRLLRNVADKDVWLAQTRLLFDLPESRFAIELLATRGERLSLHRHEFEGTVPDGGGPLALDPHLALHEVDADGRIVAIVLFDLDDEDAAYDELDARYDVLEAELHPRMTAARIAQRRPYLDRDWESFAATYAPDVACHDHRVLGWGTLHGVDAFVRTQQALVELAPDTRVRNDHVMASEHGFLVSALISGTRDGGAFELAFLRVSEIDAAGKMCRIDLYDIEDQGRALARFGELGPAGARSAAFENAASAIMEPLIAAVVANDWTRYEALFTETVRCSDRRRMVQLDFDRDAHMAFARELAEGRRARGESTTLATRGERLALVRGTFVFEDADVGPSEIDSLMVLEVDASGRIAAYVRFDLDDLDAAYAELDARFHAGEGATHPLAARWLADYLRHFATRNWGAMRALFAPDLVGHNHRLVGWGTLQGPAALVSTLEAQVALAPDTQERVDHARTCARGVLFEYAWHGTHEGGAFENVWLVLVELDPAGRARRADVWEAEQQADVLARFDALQVATGSARFANAATRHAEETVGTWMAADWERFASLFPADARLSDRRRAVQLELGREELIAFSRSLGEHATTRIIHVDTLATRGERLALQQWRVELAGDGAGSSEISYLTLMDRGEQGIRTVRWDDDAIDAAYAELDARFAAGEGAAHPHALAAHVATTAAIRKRDWDALAALCAPTFRMRDHRLLGWGTLGNDAATFVRVIRSAIELAPDSIYRDDHLRICARGTLCGMVLCGTREGGAFENAFLRVTEVDEHGRILCHDTYDESDLDRALARFAELAAPAAPEGRFENAASRAWRAVNAAWTARDLERFAAPHAAALRYRDHRRLFELDLDRAGFLDFTRPLLTMRAGNASLDLVATRGERLALMHSVMEMQDESVGPSVIESLMLVETDERGDIAAYDRWDVEDEEAAWAELDARFDAGEGLAQPLAAAWCSELRRAFASRDWDAMAALQAPDQEAHDHRLVGWGTLRGAGAWTPTLQELVTLAPDVRQRVHDLRLCARGSLWRHDWYGTRDGGAFVSSLVLVVELDGRGRQRRLDVWDADRLDVALARFHEIAAPAAPEGRFENAASRAWRTAIDVWRQRDVSRFEALHPRALRYRDHRRLFQFDLDRQGFLDFTRPLLTMRSAGVSIQLLATRGERLALLRFTLTMEDETVGPSVIDSLLLVETDERGDIAVYDRWDLEDEDAADAEIEARWTAGEGAQHPGLTTFSDFSAALERREWDAAAARYAADFVGHDHRLVSWGTVRGPVALVRTLQEMVSLAPDVRMRSNHQRACARGAIVHNIWVGTREGGAFESPFLCVGEFGADGRFIRADFYDPHHLDRAFARFEEIRASERSDLLATRVRPNLATAAMERNFTAFDALDLDAADAALDAARAHYAPDFVWDDRRPLVGLSGDLDLMLASVRERLVMGARQQRTIVATAGDRVAIGRVLWAGGPADGRFEVEFLVVSEVDEAGLFTALIFFEPGDARAAQREAWARWSVIDPVVAPWVELLNEITDAWNARDRAALGARFAADVVVEDHRHAGIGRIEGSAAYVDANAVLWDLAPDQRIEFDSSFLAFDRHGLVATLRRIGRLTGGGDFESEYVWLSLARDGRITHLELFEVEQQAAALARFEELRPDPLRIPPNAAALSLAPTARLLAKDDLDALRALVTDDFCFDDRTRRSLLRGGVEEWVRALQFLNRETRAQLDARLIATAGDRLALYHDTWQEAPGESRFRMESHRLVEIDAAGRLRALVLFDAGDRAAAHDELFERYVALGADGMPAAMIEFQRAMNDHDLARARAALPADFVLDDHRRTGLGRIDGADAYVASVAAVFELSPDARWDVLYYLAAAPHGFVSVNRMSGTNAEGGDFESPFVALLLRRDDRFEAGEMFEIDQLDAALARFEELRPDPLRVPPTTATRLRDRHRDAFVARDWDAIRALAGADFVFDDRGKRALVRGDVESWIASMEFTSQPGFRVEGALIGTLGDRIVLDHVRWFGKPDGDAFEFERVRLLEVGADGLLRAVVFFDPEDRSAASVEGLARFAAGEAAGSAGAKPLTALSRALLDRDWEAVRECFAPDLVVVDHRPLSLGTLDREPWIASLQAVDELGDRVIWEVFRVLVCSEQGFVEGVRRLGTIAGGGGPFENEVYAAALVADGRVQRYEVFGEADAERAVARFAELCAEHA